MALRTRDRTETASADARLLMWSGLPGLSGAIFVASGAVLVGLIFGLLSMLGAFTQRQWILGAAIGAVVVVGGLLMYAFTGRLR